MVADGETVDVGLVGDVTRVRPDFVTSLLDDGFIPVISTIGLADDGEVLNVNADTAASALAVALGADKLVVLTDVEGLYADWPARAADRRDPCPGARGAAPDLDAGWSRRWRPACARCEEASSGRT